MHTHTRTPIHTHTLGRSTLTPSSSTRLCAGIHTNTHPHTHKTTHTQTYTWMCIYTHIYMLTYTRSFPSPHSSHRGRAELMHAHALCLVLHPSLLGELLIIGLCCEELLIIGLFFEKWPMKMRHPMTLRHPIPKVHIHTYMCIYIYMHMHIHMCTRL